MVGFGVEFVPKDPFWKTTYYAIQAEKGGFDNVWITDHYSNRNVYVTLSMILTYTDRITVGTGVTNPYLLSPIVTAGAIASLNEIAPGRVICGIGAGDLTTLQQAGAEAKKPLAAIRESVEIMRKMISVGGISNYVGEIFKIPNSKFNFKVRNHIPIYVGAQGPKMLRLAGEIGDGVLINASHPNDLQEAVVSIREGASAAGRSMDSIDVVAYTAFSVHDDAKKAYKATVPVVAFIVAGCPDAVLEKHQVSPEDGRKIRELLVKGNFGEAFTQVTSNMVEAFAVSGTPDLCIEKIATILKTGVTQFVVGSPVGTDTRKAMNIVTSKIIPHFRKG